MHMRLSAAALAAATLLAGCASSAGLRPQGTLTAPASLHATASLGDTALSSAAWPAGDWWRALGDPQLDALMAEALRDNPTLALADARARAAQAQAGAADAARAPLIDGHATVSGARIPTTVMNADAGGGHFSVASLGYASFKWGLDLWGGQRAAWQAAVGAARAAEVDAQAARMTLSGNVARAYAQLGYAFVQSDLATTERTRADAARDLTRQRLRAGIDNQLQWRQADAEAARAEQAQALAAHAIDDARSALALLLGKGPDRALAITRPRVLRPQSLVVPDNLPVDLVGHRADIVAARWRVEAATRDIAAAKTRFLPNLSLGAMAGVVSTGGGNPLKLGARFYQLGPSLSLPLFDGDRLRADLAGRDAQYDQAVAHYNQTLIGALNQVTDAVSTLHALDAQVQAQRRARDAAEAAWQLAVQRWHAGIGSRLQALALREPLLQAERDSAVLAARRVDWSLQLIQALGGGYRPVAGSPDTDAVATGAAAGTSAVNATSSRSTSRATPH